MINQCKLIFKNIASRLNFRFFETRIYQHLQKQHNNQVQAMSYLLGASSLLSLPTSKQLIDQPYYLAPAPASLPTASTLLFQPPPHIWSYLPNFEDNIFSPFKFFSLKGQLDHFWGSNYINDKFILRVKIFLGKVQMLVRNTVRPNPVIF